ncbi:hypothetical protein KBD08_00360 [Candidatus Babeliales bacterium]|nr:hypothetical protein [Candidatus Babeliales bacterium]
MSVVFFTGLLAYGIYWTAKKGLKYVKKDLMNDQECDIGTLAQKIQETKDATKNIRAISAMIYNKELSWDNYIELFVQHGNPESIVRVLITTNSFVYELHKIASAGFFVTEKNLEQGLPRLDASVFFMGDGLEFFVVGTTNGTVVFFKNEFYENAQTGETIVACLNIEEVLSPVVGVSLLKENKVLAVAYKGGQVGIFAKVPSENKLSKYNDYTLGNAEIIHFSTLYSAPIFLSIDINFEQKIWNIVQDGTLVCLGSESLKSIFDVDTKVFLNATIMMMNNVEEIFFTTYVAVENKVDKKIEIYKHAQKASVCIATIPYEGEILCTHFNGSENLFTFYQKGGADQGVHVYNFESQYDVAHFTPHSKQYQHPLQIFLQKDKVFCLYLGGLMDMWHCDVDRRNLVQTVLEKIVKPLPDALKIEFLRQFGVYLQHKTEDNYNLLVQIGASGLSKSDVQVLLFQLQFLPPLSN